MEARAGGPSQTETPFSAVKPAEPIPPFANGNMQATLGNAMLRFGMACREEMHCRYTAQCSSHKEMLSEASAPPMPSPLCVPSRGRTHLADAIVLLITLLHPKVPPTNKNMRVDHHAPNNHTPFRGRTLLAAEISRAASVRPRNQPLLLSQSGTPILVPARLSRIGSQARIKFLTCKSYLIPSRYHNEFLLY